jgi:hypothetical protein
MTNTQTPRICDARNLIERLTQERNSPQFKGDVRRFYQLLLGKEFDGIKTPQPFSGRRGEDLYDNGDRRLYLEFFGLNKEVDLINKLFSELNFPEDRGCDSYFNSHFHPVLDDLLASGIERVIDEDLFDGLSREQRIELFKKVCDQEAVYSPRNTLGWLCLVPSILKGKGFHREYLSKGKTQLYNSALHLGSNGLLELDLPYVERFKRITYNRQDGTMIYRDPDKMVASSKAYIGVALPALRYVAQRIKDARN